MTDQPRVVPIGDWRIHRTSSAGILRLLAVAMSVCAIGLCMAAGPGLAQNEPPDPAPAAGQPATYPGPYGLQFTDEKMAAWATKLIEELDFFIGNQLSAEEKFIRERSRDEHDQAVEGAVEQLEKWRAEGKLSEDDDRALQDLVAMVGYRQDEIVFGPGNKVYRFEKLSEGVTGGRHRIYEEYFEEIWRAEGKERQKWIAEALAEAEEEIADLEKWMGELRERVTGSKSHKSALAKENWIRLVSFIFTNNVNKYRQVIDDLNAARGFPVPRK